MSPGAGERNVEVITAKLGGKASMTRGTGCAIDRDPVAVGAILAQEIVLQSSPYRTTGRAIGR